MKKLLQLVGYLHRCTKMMHGHTNFDHLFCRAANHLHH